MSVWLAEDNNFLNYWSQKRVSLIRWNVTCVSILYLRGIESRIGEFKVLNQCQMRHDYLRSVIYWRFISNSRKFKFLKAQTYSLHRKSPTWQATSRGGRRAFKFENGMWSFLKPFSVLSYRILLSAARQYPVTSWSTNLAQVYDFSVTWSLHRYMMIHSRSILANFRVVRWFAACASAAGMVGRRYAAVELIKLSVAKLSRWISKHLALTEKEV